MAYCRPEVGRYSGSCGENDGLRFVRCRDRQKLHNVPSLEAECETRADAGLARECIEGLAEPYRTVSVLYFMQEWPVEAIARQLGRMPKTVHTQLYRAKKMLRRELAAVG